MSAFVVRAAEEGQPIAGVSDELLNGRARIGWSSTDDQDLRVLLDNLEAGEPLNVHQKEARRCLGFLTRVQIGDYLLYPHQPAGGQFTVVHVAGPYHYSDTEECFDPNFRSFRPCTMVTEAVDMYDNICPSQLRHRLGRPGRFSQVYDTRPLELFLDALPYQGQPQDDPNTLPVQRIHNDLRRILPDAIRREFSQADLSRRFCAALFDRMGYSAEVQEGPGEAGSDLIVTVGNALLPTEFRVGVQAFAYEGEIQEAALGQKLQQLVCGWNNNALNYGVLLTTGRCGQDAKTRLSNHNRENPDKQVKLVEADDLADMFIRYFPPVAE